jgi:hypothetical protein
MEEDILSELCMWLWALTVPVVSTTAPIPRPPSSSWRREIIFMIVAMITARLFFSQPAASEFPRCPYIVRLQYMPFASSTRNISRNLGHETTGNPNHDLALGLR